MVIQTTVTLGDGDVMAYTADAAAMQVLVALGGNTTKDTSHVAIVQQASGSAGVVTEPNQPPPPVVE